MRAVCEISDRTRRWRRFATSLVGARHVAANALACDEFGDRAPLRSTQPRALRSHGTGHQRFDDRLRRSRAKRIQHWGSRVRSAVMAGRTTCREDLSTIWCLREGWRGGKKNGEERYKFHEMKRVEPG